MEVVNLGNLVRKSIEEAFLPGDLGGDGVNLGLVEALQGPEKVIHRLEAHGCFRVADCQGPGGNSFA